MTVRTAHPIISSGLYCSVRHADKASFCAVFCGYIDILTRQTIVRRSENQRIKAIDRDWTVNNSITDRYPKSQLGELNIAVFKV